MQDQVLVPMCRNTETHVANDSEWPATTGDSLEPKLEVHLSRGSDRAMDVRTPCISWIQFCSGQDGRIALGASVAEYLGAAQDDPFATWKESPESWTFEMFVFQNCCRWVSRCVKWIQVVKEQGSGRFWTWWLDIISESVSLGLGGRELQTCNSKVTSRVQQGVVPFFFMTCLVGNAGFIFFTSAVIQWRCFSSDVADAWLQWGQRK